MDRLTFHVDVNSAFLSWEAARPVAQGKDDLRMIPSAICGDSEMRTGVILAKSIPAKAYNITAREQVAQALRKCPGLVENTAGRGFAHLRRKNWDSLRRAGKMHPPRLSRHWPKV